MWVENAPEARNSIELTEAVRLVRAMCRARRPHVVFPPGGVQAEDRVTVEMLKAHGDALPLIADLLEAQAEQIRLLKAMAGVSA